MSAAQISQSRFDVKAWLDRPLTTLGCIFGWLFATVVFLGLTAWIGGPTEGDAALSVYSTWAIAHGHVACAYSSLNINVLPTLVRPSSFIPPLYPLLSAGVLFLVHSTYNVAFPTSAQLGNHCATANVAIYKWAGQSHSIIPTIRIGYMTWLALMAGAVALLRATGRGRKGWEQITLLFLAIIPSVFECLTEYYHPQDILAMGIALGALACALRGRWMWAGVLLGLAFTSNQFALLIAAPIFVLVPRKHRIPFAGAAAATAIAISLPMIVLTSGDAFRASVLGTGFSPAHGGTIIWLTHLSSTFLFVVSRLFPIAGAMALAWWARQRLGDDVLLPIPFLSIVAAALALRLVFEFSLWGYFFLGVATMLVLLEIVRGKVSGQLLTWLALLTVLFDPFPWGFSSNGQEWGLAAREWVPNIFAIVVGVIILVGLVRRHIRWYLVAAEIFVLVTMVKWPWNHEALRQQLPAWINQIALVPAALWLAVSPLLEYIRRPRELDIAPEVPSTAL